MRPTLRQLSYFVAVAEEGGFGAAAAALNVSQPSLSKQLATMEAELGIALFERTSRRVMLTPTGAALLPRAHRLLHDATEFRAIALGAMGLFGDKLTIGVLPSIGAYFMPTANRRLHRQYPDLRLVVREGATVQLLAMLNEGSIDAAIGTPTNLPNVESVPLFAETLWICAASDDPLSAEEGPVTLDDLAHRPLLALNPDFTLHDIVGRLAAEAGTFVSRAYEGSSLDAIRQMAVMGAGVAVLPSLYALAEAIRDPEFIVRRIDHPNARHDIHLHWRRSAANQSDFRELAGHLIAVKQEIRAARDERFR
ncbi:LysR substrate-binding domain-containing protein [Pseudaestuariivita sp.]|uniref:LysR substrate-binding domain-containing protein n=1 Tax=Pseudaestuariivita sp. TaxID=2211669 RepID=UPI0040599E9B